MASNRLESLDILRGADLFLLVILGPILHAIFPLNGSPDALTGFAAQLYHHEWLGFVLWDIIMPLFLFMSGITIPFSMAKYRNGTPVDSHFYLRLLRRFVLLFVFGWMVQGNLLKFDSRLFHPFANTLQAIAVGYVVAAIVFVYCGTKGRICVASVLFLAYIAVFAFFGNWDWTPDGNIAMHIDKAVLGAHRDGVIWDGNSWAYDPEYRYTWILSSLNFIVTVMLGSFAGQILRSEKYSKNKKAVVLAIVGAILLVASLAMSPIMPILKKIWNSSMVLYSGGICFLLMALTYYLVDVLGHKKGAQFLKYFGMNSIVAYVVGEFFEQGEYAFFSEHLLLAALVGSALLFAIMYFLYKKRIFVKV